MIRLSERSDGLTHVDARGAARMVDVSGKDVTARSATASGRVLLSPATVAALRSGDVPKGDALAVARIAGIQGAKRTPDLVPLCHPIALHGVSVDLTVDDDGVTITATTRTADRTGVEMEALTSVTAAALALIDMVKAIDPAAEITNVRVEEKLGGKTGTWHNPSLHRPPTATNPAATGAADPAVGGAAGPGTGGGPAPVGTRSSEDGAAERTEEDR